MLKIVADDKIPFLKGALEEVARVDYLPGHAISRSDLKDADTLIVRTRTHCNRELLEGTSVQFIASATIGFDHIDTTYCRSAGIQWTNAPGCNSSSVQQYLVSTLLYLAHIRNLKLDTLTLGIIGVGNVGSKVALAAEALGLNVLLNDPPRQRAEGDKEFVSLEHLLAHSHVVSLHVPLNKGEVDNTLGMVNEAFLQQMKKGSILVNTSRGGVVEEPALMKGIREGTLSDVVLDVFRNEPQVDRELLHAITLGTPHIAGYSQEGKANGTTMSVRAVSRFFNLGMDAWEPDAIPGPDARELLADASRGDLQEILWELFRQTYDVTDDDHSLREDPGSFERLRGEYGIRREPPAYAVRLFQGYEEIRTTLERLGFSVLSDYCA
jgi:erythronate-4-phosphate dehydrogenase